MLRWKLGPGHCGGCRGVLSPPRPRGDPPSAHPGCPPLPLQPRLLPPVQESSPASPWLILTPLGALSPPPPPASVSVCLSVWVTSEARGWCVCLCEGRGTACLGCPFLAWPPPDAPPPHPYSQTQAETHTYIHTHHLASLGFPLQHPRSLRKDTHTHTRARARARAGSVEAGLPLPSGAVRTDRRT